MLRRAMSTAWLAMGRSSLGLPQERRHGDEADSVHGTKWRTLGTTYGSAKGVSFMTCILSL